MRPTYSLMQFMFYVLVPSVAVWAPAPCVAQWTKTIDCPPGRVYRDDRIQAGRDEFCELLLPGSLKVRDGPSQWWFSEGHLGDKGAYEKGRKVGQWKECDRFDRCSDRVYDLLDPNEGRRGIKPEMPLSYSHGKYVFDFRSCWSTWVTRQTVDAFLELNIYGSLIRCQVTYIPSAEKDRPAGNQGHYLCEIPYAVGVREFDSLDLRKELPKAGLPQFCREDDPENSVSMPDGPPAQAVAFWASTPFVDGRTGKEVRAMATIANAIDIECATLEEQRQGPAQLTVGLNKYAEKLVLDRIEKDEVKADTCTGRFSLVGMETLGDVSGRTLFRFSLSQNRTEARRQRACIARQIALKPKCVPQQ